MLLHPSVSLSPVTMSIDWVTAKPKKRIKVLQKTIDDLNKGLETIAQHEKYYLDEAAGELWKSKTRGAKYKSMYLKDKETSEQRAQYFANMRPPVLETIAMLEGFKKREIQALQDRAFTKPQKTRRFCFIF